MATTMIRRSREQSGAEVLTGKRSFPERNLTLKWSVFAGLLWLGYIVSLTVNVGSTYAEPASHFLRDLAIAITVAVYMSYTLKRYNRQHLEEFQRHTARFDDQIRELGTNFIRAVYGHRHEPELFDAVRLSVFEAPVYHKNCRINITLTRFNEEMISRRAHCIQSSLEELWQQAHLVRKDMDRLILFNLRIRYDVVNATSAPQEVSVAYHTDKCAPGHTPSLSVVAQVNINGQDKLDTPINKEAKGSAGHNKNGATMPFEEVIQIEPGQSVHVEAEIYSVRDIEDDEYWSSQYITKDLEVEVEDLDNDKMMSIMLKAPSKRDHESLVAKREKESRVRYSVPDYLLPYQGLVIKWSPSRTSTEITTFWQPPRASVESMLSEERTKELPDGDRPPVDAGLKA